MDPYTRARTVRIGKWRWPPPKEETMGPGGANADEGEGFFEFKMRRMQERQVGDVQNETTFCLFYVLSESYLLWNIFYAGEKFNF